MSNEDEVMKNKPDWHDLKTTDFPDSAQKAIMKHRVPKTVEELEALTGNEILWLQNYYPGRLNRLLYDRSMKYRL